MEFDTHTVKETLDIIEALELVAERIQNDTMLEKYRGLRSYIHRNLKLTPQQCKIVATGCHLNKLECPEVVLANAIEAGYEPKKVRKTALEEATELRRQRALETVLDELEEAIMTTADAAKETYLVLEQLEQKRIEGLQSGLLASVKAVIKMRDLVEAYDKVAKHVR